jgi:hypothetical protein
MSSWLEKKECVKGQDKRSTRVNDRYVATVTVVATVVVVAAAVVAFTKREHTLKVSIKERKKE